MLDSSASRLRCRHFRRLLIDSLSPHAPMPLMSNTRARRRGAGVRRCARKQARRRGVERAAHERREARECARGAFLSHAAQCHFATSRINVIVITNTVIAYRLSLAVNTSHHQHFSHCATPFFKQVSPRHHFATSYHGHCHAGCRRHGCHHAALYHAATSAAPRCHCLYTVLSAAAFTPEPLAFAALAVSFLVRYSFSPYAAAACCYR